MSTKIKIDRAIQLEKDGLYLLQFNYNVTSAEMMQKIQVELDKIFTKTGTRFIILSKDYQLLHPADLMKSPEIYEALKVMFGKALSEWQNQLPRIVRP